jgi:thymidylate kinase
MSSPPRRRSAIVEFVGLPGAGKSTVARTISTRLHCQQYQIYYREDIVESYRRLRRLRLIDTMLRSDLWVWKFLWYSYGLSAANVGRFAALRQAWQAPRLLLSLQNKERLAPQPLFILDQWICHYVWGVSNSDDVRASRALVEEVANHFDVAYVFFDICVDEAVDRVERRSRRRSEGSGDGWKSPYDQMRRDEIAQRLKAKAINMRRIQIMLNTIGATVHVVDATKNMHILADQILHDVIYSMPSQCTRTSLDVAGCKPAGGAGAASDN